MLHILLFVGWWLTFDVCWPVAICCLLLVCCLLVCLRCLLFAVMWLMLHACCLLFVLLSVDRCVRVCCSLFGVCVVCCV